MTARPLTVVLGLGNPVRGDDAAGLRVVEELDRLLAAEPVSGVRTVQSRRGGFELIDLLSGADRAVIVDCWDGPGASPGRVRRLSIGQVAGCARLVGCHDIGVREAFDLARLANAPMPAVVDIYAIDAGDTSRLVEALTPDVARAVPALARQLHASLAAQK